MATIEGKSKQVPINRTETTEKVNQMAIKNERSFAFLAEKILQLGLKYYLKQKN